MTDTDKLRELIAKLRSPEFTRWDYLQDVVSVGSLLQSADALEQQAASIAQLRAQLEEALDCNCNQKHALRDMRAQLAAAETKIERVRQLLQVATRYFTIDSTIHTRDIALALAIRRRHES